MLFSRKKTRLKHKKNVMLLHSKNNKNRKNYSPRQRLSFKYFSSLSHLNRWENLNLTPSIFFFGGGGGENLQKVKNIFSNKKLLDQPMLETALSTACSAICKTRGLTLSWSRRSCWSVKNSRQMRSVCAHSRDLKMSRKAARSLLPTSSVAALTCRHFWFNPMLFWKEKWLSRSATNTVPNCKVA